MSYYIRPLSEKNGCSDPIWLTFFVFLSLAVYWPARHAGFVTDWFGWQQKYEAGNIVDALKSFGSGSILPVAHFCSFLIFKLFGTKGWVWYLITAGLHGLTAYSVFLFTRRLLTLSGNLALVLPPVAAGLLFVISPYNAEAVVWRPCLHYLLCGYFLLTALHKTLDFLELHDRSDAIGAQVWFFLGIFTLEWSIVLLLLVGTLVLAYTHLFGEWRMYPRRFAWTALPQVGILMGWFALNKHFLGQWVGHYGAATHLNIQPKIMFSTMLKYLAKHVLLLRYWAQPSKDKIFNWLDSDVAIRSAAVISGLLLLLFIVKYTKLTHAKIWGSMSIIWFFIALLPVSNLFFYYIDYSENDRYSYLPSIFISIALALCLSVLPRFFYRIALALLVGYSLVYLQKTVQIWHDSAKMTKSLREDFHWFDKDEVIILASPDNYKGIYMNRIIGLENGFSEPLALLRRTPYGGRMIEAVQYNVQNPNDGIKVEVDSTGLLYKVSFMQDGNWWWRNGIGAKDYENDRFTLRQKEWHLEIQLKEKKPNSVVIYPVAGRWLEAK